jgi:phosphoglycolate phosphatase
VVTNKESRYARAVLDAHQLAPLFDCVVSGNTLSSKSRTRPA